LPVCGNNAENIEPDRAGYNILYAGDLSDSKAGGPGEDKNSGGKLLLSNPEYQQKRGSNMPATNKPDGLRPELLRSPAAVRETSSNLSLPHGLGTAGKLAAVLRWTHRDCETGRYRRLLYRFLVDNLPLVNACLWTWVRLSSAPGEFRIENDPGGGKGRLARDRLDSLTRLVYANPTGNRTGLSRLLPDLFVSMYRDGIFGGFVTVFADASGIDRFVPVDPVDLTTEETRSGPRLVFQRENKSLRLDRPDFYYLPFNACLSQPFGRSILQAIPFVAYVEQQLVDDMRRTSHNSGYHRLHVKITPPERLTGEGDKAYTDRINGYFDSTVSMIKSLDVDDNPVTWDNVAIEHSGPQNTREITNSWFMSHRAMIEDICAGTHLAPYLLGYSFGATTTWSGFKFDVVMRQVRSVQAEVSRFLEWLGNIDLALAGIDARCRFVFDNTFTYQARDNLAVETGRVDNILKLYQAGLLDKETARERVWDLL